MVGLKLKEERWEGRPQGEETAGWTTLAGAKIGEPSRQYGSATYNLMSLAHDELGRNRGSPLLIVVLSIHGSTGYLRHPSSRDFLVVFSPGEIHHICFSQC